MVLKVILVIIIILICLYWLWNRRHLYICAWNIPCYWGIPFFGFALKIRGFDDFLPAIGKLFNQYGYIVGMWVGNNLIINTADPECAEKILSSPDLTGKASIPYAPISLVLGEGLISSPADKWKKHRRLMNPSFQHKVLLSYVSTFHESKTILIKEFNSLDDGQHHLLFGKIIKCTFGASFETTLGTQVTLGENVTQMLDNVRVVQKTSWAYILLSLLGLGWTANFHRSLFTKIGVIRNFIKLMFDTKLNKAEDTSLELITDNSDSCESIKKTPTRFVDHAVQLYRKKQLSYDDVIVECNHIVIASFETTATATLGMIIMLAMHPDVQDRVFEEICSVFPEKDFKMEYEDMQQLPYFDMIFNEVLRLVPPLAFIGRDIIQATKINDNITLPKDSMLFLSIFHLQRRKDIWGPNADKFDPDHFLPENINNIHPYAYIPFSKGPRNCIGWRYAILFVKVIMAGLIRNFKFSTDFKYEDLKFVETVTIKYKTEPKIKIQRR